MTGVQTCALPISQVNLTRFSVLFPEKRDFFLEGQDVFNFAGSGANQGGGGNGPSAIPNSGGGGNGGSTNVTPIVFFSRRIGLQAGQVVPILGGGRVLGGTLTLGALAAFLHVDAERLPVVDRDGILRGSIAKSDLLLSIVEQRRRRERV